MLKTIVLPLFSLYASSFCWANLNCSDLGNNKQAETRPDVERMSMVAKSEYSQTLKDFFAIEIPEEGFLKKSMIGKVRWDYYYTDPKGSAASSGELPKSGREISVKAAIDLIFYLEGEEVGLDLNTQRSFGRLVFKMFDYLRPQQVITIQKNSRKLVLSDGETTVVFIKDETGQMAQVIGTTTDLDRSGALLRHSELHFTDLIQSP